MRPLLRPTLRPALTPERRLAKSVSSVETLCFERGNTLYPPPKHLKCDRFPMVCLLKKSNGRSILTYRVETIFRQSPPTRYKPISNRKLCGKCRGEEAKSDFAWSNFKTFPFCLSMRHATRNQQNDTYSKYAFVKKRLLCIPKLLTIVK